MTRAATLLLTGLIACAIAAAPAAAGPGPKGGPPTAPGAPPGVVTHRAGDAFCPARALVAGNVVIPAGRCFTLSVLRDRTGTFLAFVPAGEKIPPGQLVRLNTPAGPKLRGRLFLIPLSTTAPLIPLNTLQLVPVQIQRLSGLVRVTVTGFGASVPPLEIHEK